MEINIGDKVKFLNDVGEAVVVKILSKTMALIRDRNNFEYPVPLKELLLTQKAVPRNDNTTKTTNKTIEKEKTEKKHYYNNLDISKIELAFISNKEAKNFDFFLINDSDYSFYYNVLLEYKDNKKNQVRKIKNDYLEENSIVELENITADEINNSKKIILQILFYNHPKNRYHSMVEKKIDIVPINFWQEHNYIENDFFDEKSYLINIFKEDIKENEKNRLANEKVLQVLKEADYEDKSRRYSSHKKQETVVVDLHVNNLVDTVVGLSNAMILDIQMKSFHKAVTDAILSNNIEKLVLIHGIGSGTLKNMIRESITNVYNLKFEDASYREYGFGATMIIF